MRKEIEVFIEKLSEDIELPFYANEGDSGMDIRASKDVYIMPNQTQIIPTGLKVAIPDGYEIQVRPRSGVSYKTPLRVANSIGTIDSGYKNEIGVIITNTSIPESINTIVVGGQPKPIYTIEDKGNYQGAYFIRKGDRIAQLVLQEVPKMKLTVVDSVIDIGTDRQGGFGSSGVR